MHQDFLNRIDSKREFLQSHSEGIKQNKVKFIFTESKQASVSVAAASSSAFPPEPVQPPPPPPCLPPSGPSAAHVAHPRASLLSCACAPVCFNRRPSVRLIPSASLRAWNPLSHTSLLSVGFVWKGERSFERKGIGGRTQDGAESVFLLGVILLLCSKVLPSEVPRLALISAQAFNFLVVGRDSRFACSHLTMKRRRL